MNSQSQGKHLLLISGAPRSGLKVLSNCMRYLGIKPIEASNLPDPETINQILLQDLGVSPYTPALPKAWLESEAAIKAKERIQKLLDQLLSDGQLSVNSYPLSGNAPSSSKITDTQITDNKYQITLSNPLLTELWHTALVESSITPHYILIVRHPFEVALSLQSNQGLDLQNSMILWLAHTRATLRNSFYQSTQSTTSSPINKEQLTNNCLITYDQLLADPITTLSSILSPSPINRELITNNSPALLDHVQPSLKHHHAGSFTEKETYKPYADIYNQLRLGQYSSSASISVNQPAQPAGLNQAQPDCEAKFNLVNRLEETSPQGIQPGWMKTFVSSDSALIDSLLQALGELKGPLYNTRSSLPIANDSLSTKITLPSSNKQGHITQSFPLMEDQWQKISLPITEPELLKDKPIIINPLNTIGTIKISGIRIENKSTGKSLWAIQTPQDFDSLNINDDLYRLVDLENLVLLILGPNPSLTLPLLKDLPDAPLELSIWMKANKNLRMLHKTSSSNIARFKKKDSSNLVWLASYPRSGNTWLRIVLRHNFGLKSYSVYNDTGDIGKYIEISEAVGHQYMHWESVTKVKNLDAHSHEQFSSFDSLRYKTSHLKLVKTHSQFHEGFLPDKVVYIYRDGRASLRSFASYLHDFSHRSKELNKLLNELLCGCDTFTLPWHQHILSWKDASHAKVLFLKFEDVLSDFNLALKMIADFLEIQPIRTDALTFDELHAINPDFFRKGQKKSWHDLFDDTRHALFWILNHEAMDLLGYDQDKHLICEALFHNKESGKKLEPVSASQLDYFNHILQHCGSIILAHISSIPDRNRQFMCTSLQNAHDKLAAYFSHWDAQGEHCAWTKDWEQIFTEFDNNEQE